MRRFRGEIFLAAFLFLLLVLYSLPSLALQPVETFVAGARQRNPDTLEARANLSQQEAQATATLGRVLPGISAQANYRRNQYSSQIDVAAPGQPPQVVTIVPKDQWDGSATLHVPLIDLAGFRRVSAARTSAEALVAASKRALDVSREGLRLAEARYQAGTAAILEVDRARADVEQQFQQLAAAELQVALGARALESSSGVTPDISTVFALSDDLHPEPELSTFESALPGLPSVAAAAASTRAAEKQADAQ